MNDVIEYFRDRVDPRFKAVPDAKLTEFIYNEYPEFLKVPGFRASVRQQFAVEGANHGDAQNSALSLEVGGWALGVLGTLVAFTIFYKLLIWVTSPAPPTSTPIDTMAEPTPSRAPTDFSAASLGVKRLALGLAFPAVVIGGANLIFGTERDREVPPLAFASALAIWLLVRGIDWIVRGFTKARK